MVHIEIEEIRKANTSITDAMAEQEKVISARERACAESDKATIDAKAQVDSRYDAAVALERSVDARQTTLLGLADKEVRMSERRLETADELVKSKGLKLEQIQAELTISKTESAGHSSRADTLQKQLNGLTRELTQERGTISERTESLLLSNQGLSNQVKTLTSEAAARSRSLETASRKLNTFSESTKQLKRQVAALSPLQAQVDKSQGVQDDMSRQINGLTFDVSELANKLVARDAIIGGLEEEVKELQVDINQLQSRLSTEQQDNGRLREQRANLWTNAPAPTIATDALVLANLDSNVKSLVKYHAEVLTRTTQSSADVQIIKGNNVTLRTEKLDLEGKLATAKLTIAEQDKRLRRLQATIGPLESTARMFREIARSQSASAMASVPLTVYLQALRALPKAEDTPPMDVDSAQVVEEVCIRDDARIPDVISQIPIVYSSRSVTAIPELFKLANAKIEPTASLTQVLSALDATADLLEAHRNSPSLVRLDSKALASLLYNGDKCLDWADRLWELLISNVYSGKGDVPTSLVLKSVSLARTISYSRKQMHMSYRRLYLDTQEEA